MPEFAAPDQHTDSKGQDSQGQVLHFAWQNTRPDPLLPVTPYSLLTPYSPLTPYSLTPYSLVTSSALTRSAFSHHSPTSFWCRTARIVTASDSIR
jgi:hypothetical protein